MRHAVSALEAAVRRATADPGPVTAQPPTPESVMALIESARRDLERVQDPVEAARLTKAADSLRYLAQKAGVSAEVQNQAAETALRTRRKAGQLLAAVPREQGAGGGRPSQTSSQAETRFTEYQQVLHEAQLPRPTAKRFEQLAAIPGERFERHIADARAKGELTTSGAILEAKRHRAEQRTSDIAGATPADLSAAGMFPLLYADPPWRYEAITTPDMRRVENQYPTMTADEIAALDVPAADDAVLFLWATSPKLREGLRVMDAWGFTYRTCMVWVKDRIGMGFYARQRHELLLIGRRGDLPPPLESRRPDSVIEAPRGEHSAKPDVVYDLIERMYPGFAYCELFARRTRPGWQPWGLEAAR